MDKLFLGGKQRMIKESKLRIYIWTDFAPDWSGGLAFGIAETEAEARALIVQNSGYNPSDWGTLEVRNIAKCGRCVNGGS